MARPYTRQTPEVFSNKCRPQFPGSRNAILVGSRPSDIARGLGVHAASDAAWGPPRRLLAGMESAILPLASSISPTIIRDLTMRYTALLCVALLSALSFVLSGCEISTGGGGGGGETGIVGKWQTENASGGMGFTYIFENDGTMQRAASMGAMSNPQTGTWRTVSSNGDSMTIECTLKVSRKGLTATDMWDVSFRDNDHITMLLQDSGQQPENYERVYR